MKEKTLLEMAQEVKARKPRSTFRVTDEMVDLYKAVIFGQITTGQAEAALKIPKGSQIYSWLFQVSKYLAEEARLIVK